VRANDTRAELRFARAMKKPTSSQSRSRNEGAPAAGVLPRITGACARAASRRPKTTLVLWLVLVVGLLGAGIATGTRMATGAAYGTGESEEARELLAAADHARDDPENVLITSDDARATAAAAAELVRAARELPSVERVRGPGQNPGLTTDDGRTALVQVWLAATGDDGEPRVDGVLAAVEDLRASSPGVELQVAGPAALDEAIGEVISEDLRKAELISLPITLLILLAVFGALVAAAVPLALGITSVLAAIGGMGPISQIAPMDESAMSLVILMGLAVGVDYSLFYIRREREERAAGRGPDAALAATAASVGRAIVISGATVVLALGGLALTGLDFFAAMGLATILVVAVAVVGSLTALPALLTLLGDRVDAGALPWLRRRKAAPAGGRGFWARLAALVTARPLVSIVVALSLLGALAVPALDMRTGGSNGGLAEGEAIVRAQAAIDAAFPGTSSTARLAVEGDGLSERELAPLAERAREIGGGGGGLEVEVARDGRVGAITVPVAGEPEQALERLRTELDDVAPPGSRVLVGGTVAENADFTERISDSTPVVVAAVLALAFALLLLSFRSLPLAAAVIGLNLVSVAATYGATTLIFQATWAEGLLGFTSIDAIVDWIPIFTFVILFALSMDYTILVLERMREARAAGMRPRAAAAAGVARTAAAVTSAAVVMVAIFAIFPTLPMLEMKQFGVALAIGVLLDATLVRGVALPAAVTLLGAAGLRRPRRDRAGTAGGRAGWEDQGAIAELEGSAT